ncbi:MAG TPA: UDP-glucose/GDP-mannose dehydrogenase family protein, partial [Polyangiaceae bacterium]|nr:UDP-glucose/GDP-mannose dehydrogenase family protein [Polyangiaceae bacterium]
DAADAYFIAVGTPAGAEGAADLSHVMAAADTIAHVATQGALVVVKSTVPVGTCDALQASLANAKVALEVVSNPEFLKEGDAVNDFFKPDRIVIGTDDDRAFELLERLYSPYNRQRSRIQRMSPKSAEIVKYAANAMLATKISFMNEIARLCDVAGGDAEHVRLAVGSDERIGMQFLYPGLGFGGSCFPKDLRALVHTGEELGVDLAVARAAVIANEGPVTFLLRHMEGDLGGLNGKTIAVWGLAFKPRTDDVREAPGIRLIREIVKRGGRVQATDPEAMGTGRASLASYGVIDQVKLVENEYAACEGADALVLATEWSEYRSPDLPRIKAAMRGRHVFDGRNVLVPNAVVDAGLVYRGMGRPQRGA